MDNKLSLDTGGLYLMREHANIDPVYGPYDTIQDAEDALTGDYAEVVKPGLQFAVSDGNGKYKQYIVNSLDPFDYSEIGSDVQPFEVGDTASITWSTDASGEHYANIVVGSGLTVDQDGGLSVNRGNGLTIGSHDTLTVAVGSGIVVKPNGNIGLNAVRTEWAGEYSRIVLGSDSNTPIIKLGNGLAIGSAEEATVNIGSGLAIGSNNELEIALGSGLRMQDDGEIAIMACTHPDGRGFVNLAFNAATDMPGISLGRGLFTSYNNSLLELRIGTGLRFGTGGELETCGSSQSISVFEPLVYSDSFLSLRYEDPLYNHYGRLGINLADGLELGPNGVLQVKAGDGLCIDRCHGLKVKVSNGLSFDGRNALRIKAGPGLDFDGCNALVAKVGDGLVLNYGNIVLRRKDNSLVFDGGATKVNLDGTTLHLNSDDKVSANIDNDSIKYNSTSRKVQTKGVAIQAKQGADWVTFGQTDSGSPKIRIGSGILAAIGTDAIQFDLDTAYLDTLYQRVS